MPVDHPCRAAQQPACSAIPLAPSGSSPCVDGPRAGQHDETPAARVSLPPPACPVRCSQRLHPGRSAQARTRLLEPSRHAPLRLGIGHGAPILDCLFSTSDPLQEIHTPLQALERLDVYEVGAGQAMLSNQNRPTIPHKFREKLGCSALESRNEFSTHALILKWHYRRSNSRLPTRLGAAQRNSCRRSRRRDLSVKPPQSCLCI